MSLRGLLMALTIIVVGVAFLGFVPLALLRPVEELETPPDYLTYLILVSGLGVALYLAYQRIMGALIGYTQDFHDLSRDEAEGLVYRLLFGSRRLGARMLALRVQAGQVDLDGPSIVHKVGGPAFLSIDHDSVVVTSKLGYLHRVLGPGGHRLEAFERVWDVVDLRPQRRTIVVEFMTRDGIPASCHATIVCHVAGPESVARALDREGPYYNYSDDAVVQLATSKFVRRTDGGYRVSDWIVGMANGALDGAVRDALEQYTLDEFLNPQYWLEDDDGPARVKAAPRLILELEEEIKHKVKAVSRERGVTVERVEVGTIRPAEQAISRQWLEFWQAKLQKRIDRYAMEAEVSRAEAAESARVQVRVAFLNRVLERLQDLRSRQVDIPAELVVAAITEVLETMYNRGPEVQRLLYPQAESLVRAMRIIQNDEALTLEDTGSDDTPSLTVDNG